MKGVVRYPLPTGLIAAHAGVLLLNVVAACAGDNEMGPEPIQEADVVGSYQSGTFLTTTDGETTDQRAAGAELTITLNVDGTTTGRLFMPGGAEDGSDLDASLDGTWQFDEDTNEVTFQQAAETFVRDMSFVASRFEGRVDLIGDETFGGTRIQIILIRET